MLPRAVCLLPALGFLVACSAESRSGGSNDIDADLAPLITAANVTALPPLAMPSPAMFALGQALMFDKELSGNRNISCATCHHPLESTTDHRALSVGEGATGRGPTRGGAGTTIARHAPDVFNRGLTNIFFCQPAPGADQALPFAEYILGLPEDQRPKTFAVVSADDPFNLGVVEKAEQLLTDGGLTSVMKEVYPPDTKDFSAIAAKVADLNPDLILGGTIFEDSALPLQKWLTAMWLMSLTLGWVTTNYWA